jgi:trimeric autotransporter adhesin
VNEPPPALAVYVNSGGQLGTQPPPSSRRFKQQIAPMDSASETTLELKTVTFHYESDATNTTQFGLIAEEVADVNSDLVVRDKEGKPYSVRYDAVNAMLLNEFLKEHKAFVEQQQKVQKQAATITHLQKQIEALTAGPQKVSAEIEMSKTGRRIVLNDSLK